METLQQAGQFLKPAQLTAEQRDLLIMEWDNAKKELDHWKAQEVALRLQLNADAAMFDPLKEKGTMNFTLGNGFKLVCTRKLNITVENKNGEAFQLMAELDKSENPVIKHLAKDLFKWSPELRVTKLEELKAVDVDVWNRVKSILTEKPGSPELKLIEPK